jgi:hypothetical protein
MTVEGIWLGVQPQSAKRVTVGCGGQAGAGICHTCLAVAAAISPTLRQQKSPSEDDHEELGEIDAHHALESPLDGRTGAKTFFFR